jgi:hypothetical protein
VSVPVTKIIGRLADLKIQPIVQNGELILRAKPGAITERCKQVVRENKADIIAYILRQESFSLEERVANLIPGVWTTQQAGYTLKQHIADAQAASQQQEPREHKSPWTPQAWKKTEEEQYQKDHEYRKTWRSEGYPVPKAYMGEDGYFVVPMPKGWKRKNA